MENRLIKKFVSSFKKILNNNLFISLILSSLVMLPFLTHSVFQNSQWFWGADNTQVNIPAINFLAKLVKNLSFWGVDFYTAGGSGETVTWGLLYYSPHMLFTLYFYPIDSFASIYELLYLIFFIHFTLSFYGCFKIADILNFKNSYRFILPCIYVISTSSLTDFRHQYIFFLTSSLFPLCIYAGLALKKKFSYKRAFLLSIFPFCILTTGYLPMSFFGFIMGAVFSFLHTSYSEKKSFQEIFKRLIPYFIAGIFAAPLYLTILSYLKTRTILDLNTIFSSTYAQITNPFDFFTANLARGYENYLEKIFHLPYIFFFSFFLIILNGNRIKNRTLTICFILLIFQIFSTFGRVSIFSTYFYYLKIPGRALVRNSVMMQLFWGIGLSYLLKNFFQNLKENTRFYGFILSIFICAIYFLLANFGYIPESQHTSFEILMLGSFGFALYFINEKKIILYLLLLFSIAPALSYYHSYLMPNSDRKNNFLVLNDMEYQKFSSYLKKNSKKKIIKYRNLIPKHWLQIPYAGSTLYFQNYIPYWMAHELTTANYSCNITDCYGSVFFAFPDSTDKRIKQNIKNSQFNFLNQVSSLDMTPRWDLLQRTEAEFVVYDDNYKDFNTLLEIDQFIDHSKEKLQFFSNNILFTVAQLKQKNFEDKIYSNGFIRIIGKDKRTQV